MENIKHMTESTPTEIIDVPSNLDEDEAAEFIRDEIRKRGGDPDTAVPMPSGTSSDLKPRPFVIDWGVTDDE